MENNNPAQHRAAEYVREQLAAYAHEAWAGWMIYLFSKSTANPDGTVTIPAWAVKRWFRQMMTRYAALPEEEKASDRDEAEKILKILRDTLVVIKTQDALSDSQESPGAPADH